MKTRDFVKELNNKSVDELNNELVAAKKELFNLPKFGAQSAGYATSETDAEHQADHRQGE